MQQKFRSLVFEAKTQIMEWNDENFSDLFSRNDDNDTSRKIRAYLNQRRHRQPLHVLIDAVISITAQGWAREPQALRV